MKHSKKLVAVMAIGMLVLASIGAEAKNYDISFGTGASSGSWYMLGGGIGGVVEKYNKNITVAVEATASAVEDTKLVGSREVEIALSNPMELLNAKNGVRDYEAQAFNNIRMIAAGPLMQMHVIVPASSNVKEFKDLVGCSVSTGPAGSAQQICALAVLQEYGVKQADIKEKNLTIGDAVTAMKDGNLDCIIYTSNVPVAAFLDLTNSMKVRFLQIAPEMGAQVNKNTPSLVPFVMKDNLYAQQPDPIPTIALATLLVTHDETDEDLIYAITKTLFEHYEEAAEVHRSIADFNLENPALRAAVVDFHPGAMKYLKEVGVFQ